MSTTYAERTYFCSQALKISEIKNSLTLKLHSPDQIDLILQYPSKKNEQKEKLICSHFLTPENDKNQGFYFDKIKFEFVKRNKNTLSYLDSLQHIYSTTILNSFNDQHVKSFIESSLKYDYYEGKIKISDSSFLFVKKEGDIFHIKIAVDKSLSEIKEDITLIKLNNDKFAISSQNKIGSFISDFSIFKDLNFSYEKLNSFMQKNADVFLNHLDKNPQGRIDTIQQFNGIHHKMTVRKSNIADDQLEILIFPPKRGTRFHLPIYHIPPSGNRNYLYGGLQFSYHTRDKKFSDFIIKSRKKQIKKKTKKKSTHDDVGENFQDPNNTIVKYKKNSPNLFEKKYYFTTHFVGFPLSSCETDKMTNSLRAAVMLALIEQLEKGYFFVDWNLNNILIGPHHSIYICDGLIPNAQADIYYVNHFINSLNETFGLNILSTKLNECPKANLIGELICLLRYSVGNIDSLLKSNALNGFGINWIMNR